MNKKGLWINKNTFVEFSEPTKGSLSAEIATRDRSIDFYSLGMYLPNPDPVLKKMGKDITVYSELASDAHVGGCITSRKAGVKKLLWDVDRGKSKSRQAKFVTDAIKALDVKRIISEILNAVLYGYQPLEVIWQNTGSWLPADVVGKPQRWFVFDDNNDLRLLTKQNMITGEELPPRKFLIARHEATYENPYGFAELSRCFWPATFKKGGYKFWVKFTEKYGMPWPIGKLPRGLESKEYAALADVLEQMIQDGLAVIPDDSSVELLVAEGKGATGSIYKDLIDSCKSEISIALLGHTGSSQSTPGKLGGEDQAGEVRQDIVDDDKGIVEQTMNILIEWIAYFNFSERVELPKFILYKEEDVDKVLAERDEILRRTGVKFKPQYYVKNYGLAEEDFEVKDTQPPAPPFRKGEITAEFAESPLGMGAGVGYQSGATYPDQAAVDKAADNLNPATLQAQMEGVLKPVLDLIKKGTSYDDIMSSLAEAYPNMDNAAVEEMLSRAIFVTELWGRINAEK